MNSSSSVSAIIPVFRNAALALGAANALARQILPSGTSLQILVVDDGSDDGAGDVIESKLPSQGRLIQLRKNVGRSRARNVGAEQASGDLLLFMDCDCIPTDDDMITAHLRALTEGVVASIGAVVGNRGFWDRYQTAASERRARQHAAGLHFSGSSQNLMVSSAAFRACGGFDDAYGTYGFEDRDLQLRIAQYGRIAWAADASVRHMDALSMVAVSRKMIEAGGPSAVLFARRHPKAYRQLGYAALDTRIHGWLRLPARLLSRLIGPMARIADRMIAMSLLPYSLKSWTVKALSAMSYLVGTKV